MMEIGLSIKTKFFTALNQGYTLIEVLVSTAIIGILMVISSAIFINTIQNANKASIVTEARENASLVSDSLERDIRKAFGTVTTTGSSLTLTTAEGTIVWSCEPESGSSNGHITRNGKTLTNRDATNGVSWNQCVFSVSGTTNRYLVTLNFTLIEGTAARSGAQTARVSVKHTVSASTRGF